MAEPLKNQFGVEIPDTIGRMIFRVFPAFEHDAFVKDALDGYVALDLMPRGWKIARTLRGHLPVDYFATPAYIGGFSRPFHEGQWQNEPKGFQIKDD
ncbi:MAG: hypothetical protein WAO55_07960 [Candidatus Manganitrophaceae bacterium]